MCRPEGKPGDRLCDRSLWRFYGKLTDELPENGHFEFRLPKALLADNPKTVTLSWIDYFRK